MLFSGIVFLLFFLPIFFGVYYLLPSSYRNLWTLLSSVAFYAWGAPQFVFLVLISALLDYILAKKSESISNKHWPIYLGVVANILLLIVFKYFNFFQGSFLEIAKMFGFKWSPLMQIALPLGISFLAFQKISFLIDVKREDAKVPDSFFDYLLFVLLFPQLIAGPILRYKTMAAQLTQRHFTFDWGDRLDGFYRFSFGLAKKVLIADQLAPLVAHGYDQSSDPSLYFMAALAYTFQIYFDFSGYSDMAIGLGKMMDFKFPENFEFPYKSKGIRAFWRKWHITLGNWMQDYLYIPLGGNRVSGPRVYINLWIVFLLSGLWHGASFNFLIWGAWHGLALSLEHRFKMIQKLPSSLIWLLTFIWVALGWIWFRVDGLSEAAFVFQGIFTTVPSFHELAKLPVFVLFVAILFSFLPANIYDRFVVLSAGQRHSLVWARFIGIGLLWLLCFGAIAHSGEQPFIYFRF
jgi:alginate O-acetyltransferase complex protein AlgI